WKFCEGTQNSKKPTKSARSGKKSILNRFRYGVGRTYEVFETRNAGKPSAAGNVRLDDSEILTPRVWFFRLSMIPPGMLTALFNSAELPIASMMKGAGLASKLI